MNYYFQVFSVESLTLLGFSQCFTEVYTSIKSTKINSIPSILLWFLQSTNKNTSCMFWWQSSIIITELPRADPGFLDRGSNYLKQVKFVQSDQFFLKFPMKMKKFRLSTHSGSATDYHELLPLNKSSTLNVKCGSLRSTFLDKSTPANYLFLEVQFMS